MKKIQFNYSLLAALGSIIVGVMLLAWPQAATVYLVIAIGVIFIVTGVIALFGYLTRAHALRGTFPIAGIGSILFGTWLVITPVFFIKILMYVLGAVLVIAGILQIVGLSKKSKQRPVALGYYVVPVLIVLAGGVVLYNPFTVASIPFIVLGVSALVYGLFALISIILLQRKPVQRVTLPDEPTLARVEEVEVQDVTDPSMGATHPAGSTHISAENDADDRPRLPHEPE